MLIFFRRCIEYCNKIDRSFQNYITDKWCATLVKEARAFCGLLWYQVSITVSGITAGLMSLTTRSKVIRYVYSQPVFYGIRLEHLRHYLQHLA